MAHPIKRKEMAYESLRNNFMAEQTSALHNLMVYFENPAGIGEHPDLQEEMRKQVEAIANAEDALETLDRHRDMLLTEG
jgi:hypothetical protein